MIIKVLGSGCKSCITFADNVKLAVSEMGIDANVVKITDFATIAEYGVMQLPALVIDEKTVSYGKVLKPAEVKKIFERIM